MKFSLILLAAQSLLSSSAARDCEIPTKDRATNGVLVLTVSPKSFDSGFVMSWTMFSGVHNRKVVTFFNPYLSEKSTPPPEAGQVCDINYHVGPIEGNIGGTASSVSDAWVVDTMKCRKP